MIEQKEKAQAVGHIPSGLFIVTAKGESSIDGYLASWVQQVSFNPLIVAVAINPDRPGYKTISGGDIFAINIVGDHDTQYMRHFWSGYAPDQNPFQSDLEFDEKLTGAVILKGAKSAVECRMISKVKPGDHEIVFAEVVNSYVLNDEAKPKVHIRKSGLDY